MWYGRFNMGEKVVCFILWHKLGLFWLCIRSLLLKREINGMLNHKSAVFFVLFFSFKFANHSPQSWATSFPLLVKTCRCVFSELQYDWFSAYWWQSPAAKPSNTCYQMFTAPVFIALTSHQINSDVFYFMYLSLHFNLVGFLHNDRKWKGSV